MSAPDDGASRAHEPSDDAPHTDAEPRAEKRPLFRPLPPPPEFPIRAMGGLRAAAEAVHGRTQAPLSMCAQSVLAAVTLAVQPHRDVELPGGGRKPLTGLFASVADSGERKTSVDRIALAPVYEVEEELRAQAGAELGRYVADLAAWKEAAERIKKAGKGDRAVIRDGLLNLGPEPKAPPHPMLLVADPTPEALVLHLAEGRPSAGVFTAEGGLLVGGAAFNDDARMRTAALFNTLWDGEPIRRRRVLTGASFLPGRRCSMHVMLQPVVADGLFGDSMLDGIGMLARVLVVAPESTAGTRMFREVRDEDWRALTAYRARVGALLRKPPATKPDDAGILDPAVMHLAPTARALWIEFANDTEAAIAPGGPFAPIKAFAAKMAEHAGRLAAVLAVYDDPEAMEVPPAAMAGGIALAQHYAQEMLRLAGVASINPDLRLAHRLLVWWREQGGRDLHLAAIYQRGPNALRDAATARRVMRLLEEHGYAEPLPPATEVDGAPRKEAWELSP
jgi:hypothetical protein